MEIDKKVGAETELKAEAKDNKIRLSVAYVGVDLGMDAGISCTTDQLIGVIAKLIPGDSTAEHAALAVVKGALDLVMSKS